MNLEPLPLFLIIFSGCCWTLVYLDGIRVGLRDHSYAIPFWALALNFAWEVLNTIFEYQQSGIVVQVVISAIWTFFDIGILLTYFRYGRTYFPTALPASWFLIWSVLGLGVAFLLQAGFIQEFGLFAGRAYAAFLQNLLMSVLFIGMLVQRGSREGQSLTIAISKWLGTLAPTILFGVVGAEGFDGPNRFILTVGLCCSLFDLIYIGMLVKTKAREGASG